jgi:FixJ family two-component response regulator
MPGMSGAQLAEAVQAGWPGLPVLMTSGFADIPAGTGISVPRLNKPFREGHLVRAIEELIGEG